MRFFRLLVVYQAANASNGCKLRIHPAAGRTFDAEAEERGYLQNERNLLMGKIARRNGQEGRNDD